MNDATLAGLAALATSAGLIVGLAVFAATRQYLLALQVGLELWVAAGLIRLAGTPSWAALAGTAGILFIRQITTRGLRAGRRAASPS